MRPDEVVFGPNMTSLAFMLSRSIGREIQPGDEIVLTRLDHDANFSPWKALEERSAVVKVVDIDTEDCTLDMDDLRRQITPRTKLVAVGYASNAVGTINDVAEVVRLAKEVGALSFIDAVHYAPMVRLTFALSIVIFSPAHHTSFLPRTLALSTENESTCCGCAHIKFVRPPKSCLGVG